MSDMKREAAATVREHGFVVRERAQVEIKGMTQLISFDEASVQLATTSGSMTVEGSELHVNILDVKEGTVLVDGHIDSVYYTDTEQTRKRTLMGRLWH